MNFCFFTVYYKGSISDRKRSHFSEWKVDLLTYIEESTSKKNPYLNIKKKDVISQLGIPERSLDYVLKELKHDNKIFYTFKRGRGGGIRVASISAILSSLITLNKEKRQKILSTTFRVARAISEGFRA